MASSLIPRGAMPDAERPGEIFLIKATSQLRATYQIRLLAFRAVREHSKLVLSVPSHCVFEESLRHLVALTGDAIVRADY